MAVLVCIQFSLLFVRIVHRKQKVKTAYFATLEFFWLQQVLIHGPFLVLEDSILTSSAIEFQIGYCCASL